MFIALWALGCLSIYVGCSDKFEEESRFGYFAIVAIFVLAYIVVKIIF